MLEVVEDGMGREDNDFKKRNRNCAAVLNG